MSPPASAKPVSEDSIGRRYLRASAVRRPFSEWNRALWIVTTPPVSCLSSLAKSSIEGVGSRDLDRVQVDSQGLGGALTHVEVTLLPPVYRRRHSRRSPPARGSGKPL